MSASVFLVVMAGGSGTRFWPKSTSKKPKQLLSFDSNGSLISQTLARFDKILPPQNKMIVTTELLRDAVAEQVNAQTQILAEPQGRNTAPCIYWAAREIGLKDPQAVMVLMPSDHAIMDVPAFQSTLQKAIAWASQKQDLVTLGVRPTYPETGYGYLKVNLETGGALGNAGAYQVEAFVEKPGIEKAREFLKSGKTLWNGGMFVWRVDAILAAFDRYLPEYRKVWDEGRGEVKQVFSKLTAISIDYGVMEKADNVVAFPLECGWDDLGSWTSLESLAERSGTQTKDGVIRSKGHVSIESTGNIVDAPERFVALLGVNDLVIVESGDVILVAKKDQAQDIKKVVEAVKKIRPDLV